MKDGSDTVVETPKQPRSETVTTRTPPAGVGTAGASRGDKSSSEPATNHLSQPDPAALQLDNGPDLPVTDVSVTDVPVADSHLLPPGKDTPSHVVGIGASAGGLPALQAIFEGIPPDTGAAFVVVQHLSPNFNTLMDELIARHSAMTVKLADDGEYLRRNRIYVMRPSRNIIVSEGKLLLNDIHRTVHPNLPIDQFFKSLAADAQNRSVGIVLSGTGSDGSHGVKALREAGGLVMVQQPADAEFDGMPIASIRTGYVDTIGDVGELASQLVSYIQHPLTASKNLAFREHLANNHDLLQDIFVKLKNTTGIDFSLYKPTTIARRIEHRMGINNIETLPVYSELLSNKPQEFDLLKSDLLIGVTQFFRDKEPYLEIAKTVLPSILESKSPESAVRVWMVGVSSGEEAYSLAMLITELMERHDSTVSIKIFASDADSDAIDYASAGVYPPNVMNDISAQRLSRFFKKDESGNYVVNKSLRNMIVFATHNVLEDPPFSQMDLVVCRNMLIYFQTEAQERTIALFNFALRDNGFLWLGSSESLGGQADSFSEFSSSSKIWRKARSTRLPIKHINPDYVRRASARASATGNQVGLGLSQRYPREQRNIYQSVRDRLLEEYGPDGILLNSNHLALHVFGNCVEYLGLYSAGRVTTHIDTLLSPELVVPVSTCLSRLTNAKRNSYRLGGVPLAESESAEQTSENSDAGNTTGNIARLVDITVRKLTDLSRTEEVYFLVLFSSTEQTSEQPPEQSQEQSLDTEESVVGRSGKSDVRLPAIDEQYSADTHTRERLRELDLQLIDSQHELRNAYAELDTTSEELQATNEELMAANEELQSTNEELQSVNEELYSVNTEYQEKISELMELNTDLDNLLNSTGYGIIFLDSTLAIRRFTAKMAKFINLLPGDLERPITDFKFNIHYPDMVDDLTQVLNTGVFIEKEAATLDSLYNLSIHMAPYISTDNTINGVVMTVRETVGT